MPRGRVGVVVVEDNAVLDSQRERRPRKEVEHCELKPDKSNRALAPCPALCKVCFVLSGSCQRGTRVGSLHCLCSGHPDQDVVCCPWGCSGTDRKHQAHSAALPAPSSRPCGICSGVDCEVGPITAFSCAKTLLRQTQDDVSH